MNSPNMLDTHICIRMGEVLKSIYTASTNTLMFLYKLLAKKA